ncbi:MAG: hypothetical protein OMM_15380, partial [Candidatus Magnetoglobus multicellularis str. Araruama]
EDTAISSISFTATDIDTAACLLDITFASSNTLVSVADISYTCNADVLYLSLTPVADQSGTVNITIIATDAGGLTSATSFALDVTPVEDAPVITSDTTFSMNEDSTASFTLTATDAESADCSLDITFASSNTALLSVENISYTCVSAIYFISITPNANQSGNLSLSITVTDS